MSNRTSRLRGFVEGIGAVAVAVFLFNEFLGPPLDLQTREETLVVGQTWVDPVLDDHWRNAAEGEYYVTENGPDACHRRLEERIPGPLLIPDLSSEGLTFYGCRLVYFDNRMVPIFAYRENDNDAFSLAMMNKPEMESDMRLSIDTKKGLQVAEWGLDQRVFALIGLVEEWQLRRIQGGVKALYEAQNIKDDQSKAAKSSS